VGDIAREYYRPKHEEQQWRSERDPIRLYSEWLIEQQLSDRASLERIEADLVRELDAAVEFAVNAPYPDIDKVDDDIYA
jgi:pyruvate dehydrogenase E1 component alpha subunit